MRAALLLVFSLALVGSISAQDDIIMDDEDISMMDESQFEDVDPALFEQDEPVEEDEPQELNVPKEERPIYKAPVAQGNTYFADAVESEADYRKKWMESKAKKDDADDEIAKYDGVWSIEEPTDNGLQGDLSIVLKSKAKHHATAAKLRKPFEFKGKPFIVQYEVKLQNGQECGGAYIKLLSKEGNEDLRKFYDKSPYTIMFGPDKCGNDKKLHFIFRHKNPVTGEFEEKHAKKPTANIDAYFTDKRTHLYTLVVKPDNTFEVYIDQNLVNSGSLLEDMEPPVNPAKEIIDPEDNKPEDWDEREKIPDPDASKPEDWDEDEPEKIADEFAEKPTGWLDDEAELIPDEDSEKPDDWDEDMDGEWEPPMITNPKCEDAPGCGPWTRPMIKNPKYKGKWRAPVIDNPNYKGKWKARMIPNPNFFEDLEPYKMTTIGAVGLELWSMSDDIAFDNFIITDDKAVADTWAADSWELKHAQELSGGGAGRSVVDAVMDATTERPWLWAVFVVVILLPIVLVIAYCCMPGSSSSGAAKQDDIAKRKKTDEPSPDAEKEEEEEEEEDDEDEEEEEKKEEKPASGAGDSSQKDSKKKGKSQLEADDANGDGDDEEEEEEEEAEKDSEKTQTRSSPRKRKGKARMD